MISLYSSVAQLDLKWLCFGRLLVHANFHNCRKKLYKAKSSIISFDPSTVQKVNTVVRLCSRKVISIEMRSAVFRFGPAHRNVMDSLTVFIQRLMLDILLKHDNVRFKQWQMQCTYRAKGYRLDQCFSNHGSPPFSGSREKFNGS